MVSARPALQDRTFVNQAPPMAGLGRSQQPALFELKDDRRPESERTTDGRYREPGLFTLAQDAGG